MTNKHIIVYEIVNTVNGHNYIGITKRSLRVRWAAHVYSALIRKCRTHLGNALRKYGPDAFTITPIASVLSRDHAWESEREIIRDRKPTYNLTNGGEWTEGKRGLSPEAAERIRQGSLGKKRTPDQNKRSSEAHKASYAANPDIRAAAIARIKAANSLANLFWKNDPEKAALVRERKAAQIRKKVECIELATVFDSTDDAAEGTGAHQSKVSLVCNGKRKQTHGLTFRFV